MMHCLGLEQERFLKMNRSWANTCLTDMINISIESFKWSLNEIIKHVYFIIILILINKDAFLSKGVSNEEMASQDQQLRPCDMDSTRTKNSLLVNNSNISLIFPADTFTVIMFAGALRQALAYCVHLNAELFSCAEVTCARCCCGTLNTVKPILARSRVVSTSAAIFLHH